MELFKLLSQRDLETVTSRIGQIPIAYEADYYCNLINTTSYPELVLAIPYGKKFCVYFSYHADQDVCYLIELNREKVPVRLSIVDIPFKQELSLGTLLYGTFIPVNTLANQSSTDGRHLFMIEDIYLWKGMSTENMMFSKRLGYIQTLFDTYGLVNTSSPLQFYLPTMWYMTINTFPKNELEQKVLLSYYSRKDTIIYQVHHLQMRNVQVQSPYLNVQIGLTNTNLAKELISNIHVCPYTHDYFKPAYKNPATFIVKSSSKYDIYHLYCMNPNHEAVFYGLAGIPDMKTSVLMNLLFRNLKENMNLDYIQESDDEDDVHPEVKDMNQQIHMICEFHMNIKKWVPTKVVTGNDVVKLNDLINTASQPLHNKTNVNMSYKPASKKMK